MDSSERPLFLSGLVALVGGGTLVVGALTPRDLSLGEDAPIWNADPGLLAFDLSRGLTALALLACLVLLLVRTIHEGLPRAGHRTWLAYLAFIFTNFALPTVAAHVPVADYRLFLVPVLFTGVYLARSPTTADLERLARWSLLAFVYASLAAAVVNPDQAVAAGYEGLLPGLDGRLYGVGGGATSLGLLSSSYLAIELVAPSPGRARYLHLAAAALALVLTQAKTSWAFVILVLAITIAVRTWRRLPAPFPGGASAVAALGLAGLLAAGAAGAALAATAHRVDVNDLGGGENLTTLTGRTYIWATSLATWAESPIFGYGLGLWESASFRAEFGPFDHSHNQFIHALASAGVIGLLGLLAYLGRAFMLAVRHRDRTAVPLVLLGAVVFLCFTNTPLRAYYVLDAFVLVHLLVFACLVHLERQGESLRARPSTGP